MKKLFSLGLVFAMLFLTAACGADDETVAELKDDMESMQQEIAQLQQQIDSLQLILGDKGEQIDSLQEELDALKAKVYDGALTFTVDTGETVLSELVHYRDNDELTPFDMLLMAYDVEYSETDFGYMIDAVDSLDAPHGSFIHISKNDTSLDTGLDAASYEDGDHFHFERQWWDPIAESLYDSIHLFTNNHLSQYIEPESVNLHVLAGLAHQDMLEDHTFTLKEDSELETAGDLSNGILKRMILGESYEGLQSDLDALASTDWLYPAALSMIALHDYEDSDFETDFLSKVEGTTIEETDHDSLIMAAFALSLLETEEATDHYDAIVEHLLEAPHDFEYGPNGTSYAMLLMLFAYEGIDINDESLLEDGKTVLDLLLDYQTEEGAFVYLLDDEDADMAFTTPQAFLAISYYYAVLGDSDAFLFPAE